MSPLPIGSLGGLRGVEDMGGISITDHYRLGLHTSPQHTPVAPPGIGSALDGSGGVVAVTRSISPQPPPISGFHSVLDAETTPPPPPQLAQGNSLDAILGPFPCVRMRGIPYEATMQDIVTFFRRDNRDGGIVDVVLPTHPSGKASGEAFVLFANRADTERALAMDRQKLGRRYIEIFQAPRDIYYGAIGRMLDTDSGVKTGMATGSFMTPPPVAALSHDGPGPLVPVASPALRSDSQGRRGGRDLPSYGAKAGSNSARASPGDRGNPIRRSSGTPVLRMRGLPFSATRQDVLNFFGGLEVIEDSIKFATRSDGRVTGEAYVEFDSGATATEALKRDRGMMGSRYVELFQSSRQEAAGKKGVH
mmetsp:Transcript_9723/g.36491  ORF Transcript_9723/g.36491 Transcript_9723/m.36491 type:complete len:363 (-) Transcript_9723:357-1445(-)